MDVPGVGEGEVSQSVRFGVVCGRMTGEDGPQEMVFGVLAGVGCRHAEGVERGSEDEESRWSRLRLRMSALVDASMAARVAVGCYGRLI